eukprot:gb/GECH01001456.1/.p1 GENE.gb/GECH01001456.1/~~gb/GECH01001456.1/.p1  ORF type:complete len:383 (+),score=63.22 gb/GECH01001456.1/:1-1149(+)
MSLKSKHLSRISVLLNQVIPHQKSILSHNTRKNLSISSNFNPQYSMFNDAICFAFVSNTHHLTISNACEHAEEFKSSPDTLQRTLISTNNDVVTMVNMLVSLKPQIRTTIFGRASVPQVKRKLISLKSDKLREQSNTGVILYWSGHAILGSDSSLLLCLAPDDPTSYHQERHIPVQEVFNWCGEEPLLFIMDCCHSGRAVEWIKNYENGARSKKMIMASCDALEVSGSWVLDGSDSGGIMTKFLTDPIGTYFKVKWTVFCDLEGSMEEEQSSIGQLYNIFDRYTDDIMKSCLPDDDLELIQNAGSHVYTLWKHFLLLSKYGDQLYRSQSPISIPDLSPCLECDLWSKFEDAFEERVVELWTDKYHVDPSVLYKKDIDNDGDS